MTDRYEELREALGAGPTNGPWKIYELDGEIKGIIGNKKIDVIYGCGCCFSPNLTKVDAEYISACHPEAIRALLAEKDALRATVEELIDAAEGRFFGNGNDPDGTLRSVVAAARAALAQGES